MQTKDSSLQYEERMDTRFRNFEYGPLGDKNVLRIKNFVGFSEDGKSATFEIELKPGQHYQILTGELFRSANGISLAPYLIDITTADK